MPVFSNSKENVSSPFDNIDPNDYVQLDPDQDSQISSQTTSRNTSLHSNTRNSRISVETSPLLDPEPNSNLLEKTETAQIEIDDARHAGVPNSIFNLTNTIIGGGVLALPYSFAKSGLVLGIILLILVGLFCLYSADLLDKAGLMSGLKKPSYNDLAMMSMGRWGSKIVDLCLILFLMGACIGYVIIIGDILTPFCEYIDSSCDVSLWKRIVMVVVAIFVLFPLLSLRHINSLTYTSVIAILCIGYLVLIITIKGIISLAQDGIDTKALRLFQFNETVLTVIPVMAFAFSFHMSVYPIQNEMREPSKLKYVTLSSVIICAVTYLSIASFGYLRFYQDVDDNILVSYSTDDIEVEVGKVALVFIITFSYPILGYPAREAFDHMFFNTYAPWWRLCLESLGYVLVTLATALVAPNIAVIYGFFGATVGNIIVYVLPPWFYLALKRKEPDASWKNMAGPAALFCCGITMMVVCTLALIVDLALGDVEADDNPDLHPDD